MADIYIKDVPATPPLGTDKVPASAVGGSTPKVVTIQSMLDMLNPVIIASTALGGHRVITSAGTYASSSNIAHAYAILGITLQAVSTGDPVQAKASGVLEESSWNWSPAQPVYLGLDGQLTQTAQTTGFIAEIGRPLNSTTLLIDIQQSIILA